MNKPLISIIVPCYNVEKYLNKCVDSLVNQTYTNLEIWLVDDGSPDRCGEICDDWAKRDSRIKVIHKANGGLSDARNAALDVMAGDYVTFVDSDDYVAEDYIENLYNLLVANGTDIGISQWNMFYEGEEPKQPTPKMFEKVFNRDDALALMFYQDVFETAACMKLYKASLFNGIRYPKGYLFEDLATTYKLIAKSKTVSLDNNNGYYYLLRNNSIEGAPFKPQKYESAAKIIEQLENDRHKFSPRVQRALDCRLISFAFHIMLQIPEEHKEMRQYLWNRMKKYRWSVLTDGKARRKARLAALLSYGGAAVINIFARYGMSR